MSYESPATDLFPLIFPIPYSMAMALAPTVWAATPDEPIYIQFGRLRIKLY